MSLIDYREAFLEEPLNFSIKEVQNKHKQPKRYEVDGSEEKVFLHIARFAAIPKLDFGKVHVNKCKVLELFIHNPHDYPVVIYIDKPSAESDFKLELNEIDLEDEGNRDVESPDIVMGLQQNESRSIFVRWSPTVSGNVRETLSIKWEGGSKLQVVFLGSATGGNQRKRKIPQPSRGKSSKSANVLQPPMGRKMLSTIQPDTPSRRTTFSISNPHQNGNSQYEGDKENNQSIARMKSCSPLSFEKTNQPPHRTKPNLTIPKTQRLSLDGKKRRETFSIPKKESTNRILFGSQKPNNMNNTMTKISSNKQKEISCSEDNNKPKPFLRRKSTSQTLSKPLYKGLALKKLKLTKEAPSSMPRHPMPFAAKNMFYDERWIDKQERGFANWLNFVLTPSEDEDSQINNDQEVVDRRGTFTIDAGTKQAVAPTREDVSFRAYSIRRRMSQLRRSACMMYQSEEFMFVIHKIEKEVECGLFAVRMEKHILADLGIKNQILKMLLSYNSLWLRIGLEVIYGELILLHSNSDVSNLSKFVTHRLLANPDIAAQYSHSTVPNLFKPGYEEALSKFALKKFLLLVLFLDHAKRNRLIDHDPCLFNKESEFKATRDMLLLFSRDFLKGEGDITKHLSYMGITIAHSQTVLNEYDFGIKNIAVDLRDGVRLIRVVELLTQNWSLSKKVRLPAISRLQKVHNVGVALQCLTTLGLSLKQDAKCVVDGHREKTLFLLWQIIFHFQVGMLLDVQKLKEEVNYLQARQKLQHDISSVGDHHFLGLSRHATFDSSDKSIKTNEDQLYFTSEKLSLLLKWCQAVCGHYEMKIENFTVSFSDGIAFCCLVNFYHPDILPKSLINHETTQTCSISQQEEDVEDDFFYDNWTKCFSPNTGINRRLESLLHNEKENYRVLNEAIHELGGIPSLLRTSDMSNTIPDEKVVITYVSYLCSRLLNIQKESRAARIIQLAWQRYILSKRRFSLKLDHVAAEKIQNCFRAYITRMNYLFDRECVIICQSVVRRWLVYRQIDLQHAAAYIIQSVFRGHLETSQLRYRFLQTRASSVIIQRAYREHLHRQVHIYVSAALLIQSYWKGYKERMRYKTSQFAASVIQKTWRMHKARAVYVEQLDACLCIQYHWRRCLWASLIRKEYQSLRSNAIKIQRFYRNCLAVRSTREKYLSLKQAVTYIQASFRMRKARKEFTDIKSSVVTIQTHFRAYLQAKKYRHAYLLMRGAVISLQSHYRRRLVQKELLNWSRAASTIKMYWKLAKVRDAERQKYRKLRETCIFLQSMCRMKMAREMFLSKKSAVIVIQRALRNAKTRKQEYIVYKTKCCIVHIQSTFRCYLARKRFLKQKVSIIRIQTCWRAYLAAKQVREQYLESRRAAVCIQSAYCMVRTRRNFLRWKNAAITIQANARMFICRKSYMNKRSSAVKIQSQVKRWQAQKSFTEHKKAVVMLQSICRMFNARRNFHTRRSGATQLQRWFRKLRTKRRVQMRRHACVKIQSLLRTFLQRSKFMKQRKSAITLQSAFRGYKTRVLYQLQRSSCIRIQSAYRSHMDRTKYLVLRSSAITIQTMYRMYSTRRKFIKKFSCAVKIQSFARMISCKQHFQNGRKAAILIQSVYRKRLAEKQYVAMLRASVILQSWWKMVKVRREYLGKRYASLKLQAVYRSYCVRKALRTKTQAAVVIQSYFRRVSARTTFLEKKNAAIQIQCFYRMMLDITRYRQIQKAVFLLQCTSRMYILRNRYLRKKEAALVLQAVFRGHVARKNYRTIQIAIIRIQSFLRMNKERTHYMLLRDSALKIQFWYHKHRVRKTLIHQLQRNAVIKMEAVYMTYCIRKDFLAKRNAVISLQAHMKMRFEQRRYSAKVKAVVRLQCFFRMVIQKTRYKILRKATLTLQTFFRMRKLRMAFKQNKIVAIKIQSLFRMSIARRRFLICKRSVISIQSTWRMNIQRRSHLKKLRSLIILQSFVRMHHSKKLYLDMKQAALKIQSSFRMSIARRRFLKCKQSALLIQSTWRMNIQQRNHLKKIKSLVILQSFVRMHQSKKQYLDMKQAALKIQSSFRMQQQRKYFLLRKHAVVLIQSFARMVIERSRYTRYHDLAIKLQSTYRMHLARQQYSNMKYAQMKIAIFWRSYKQVSIEKRVKAVKIQAWWRMVLCNTKFQKKLAAVTLLQRCLKEQLNQQQCRKKRNVMLRERHRAATLVQSTFKMHRCRKNFLQMKASSVCIQRYYRAYTAGYPVYLRYHISRGAAITIQAQVRGYLSRVRREKKIQSVRIIQSYARMFLERRRYQRTKEAVEVLQNYTRRLIARRRYLRIRTGIICIQKFYRNFLKRTREDKLRHLSAIKIQNFFKMAVVKRRLQDEKKKFDSAVKIQSSWKRHVQVRRYNGIVDAVCILQWFLRGILSRKHFLKQKNSAITIQRCYRQHRIEQDSMYQNFHTLVLHTKAVRTIEAFYLSQLEMKEQRAHFLRIRNATVILQTRVRIFLCTLQNRRRDEAAVRIQNVYRLYKERQLQKVISAQRLHIIAAFAETARKCLCVLKIQRWHRRLLLEKEEKRRAYIQLSAVKIQCLWRGYFVRQCIKDKRLKVALERIDAANSNATEQMKLCNRTQSALDYLLKVKNLSTVYEALLQLDLSTSLSFQCCERLVSDNALPVIYRIINYGNRSLPWISIKQVAFSILLNLAKCQKTYRAVYEAKNSLEYIVEQMANFRDKKASIFSMACSVLIVLCYDDVIKMGIQKNSKVMEKISTFLKLSQRKHKISTQRKLNNRDKEDQQYSKTAWHKRASSIHTKDSHIAIEMLARKLSRTT